MKPLLSSWRYSQPEFYHFSEDSIALTNYVIDKMNGIDTSQLSLLEPFAGCGVIGIEIAGRITMWKKIHFIELQNEFKQHIEKNISAFIPKLLQPKVSVTIKDYLQWDGTVDVIVANPPYFIAERSRPSIHKKKQICRQMKLEDFKHFFQFCNRVLNSKGYLFFCARENLEIFFSDVFRIREKKVIKGATLYFLEKTD